ncbi:protein of unknown function (DU1801) [Robiginitalea myxolifaciens]|uniref:YdhG-like domain-containing protein n=1 Tax=Robiginitalea myxolifaciens TaxID=400055 RepID=A0A1I6FX39_9FLAO|nr:DUF1801 domain-containing protein [Robiginitalea myxolifaciens]SFR34387.1 protein of unknown function (DU1801) [Robiginitalea myxolifaciens]
MRSDATSPKEYLSALPEDRQAVIGEIRQVLLDNLPKGFEERMSYGMLGFVVPHEIYPDGYHCDPSLPLPFINLASQKNFIGLYHMGIYSDPELLKWFQNSYAELSIGKLDMGKSCIRFKKMDKIPFQLIGELASKMTPQDWIARYESEIKK